MTEQVDSAFADLTAIFLMIAGLAVALVVASPLVVLGVNWIKHGNTRVPVNLRFYNARFNPKHREWRKRNPWY